MVLKKPFFFGSTITVLIALQGGTSYYSINYFLEGDLLMGFLFLFLVPILAFLMGFYFVWFRRQRMAKPLK